MFYFALIPPPLLVYLFLEVWRVAVNGVVSVVGLDVAMNLKVVL